MSLVIVSSGSPDDVAADITLRRPDGILIVAESFPGALDLACRLQAVAAPLKIPLGVINSLSDLALPNGSLLSHLQAPYSPEAAGRAQPGRRVIIDQRAREVMIGDRRLTCSPMELRFLIWFLRYPNIVFSRVELLRRLSTTEVRDPRIVDVFVRRIRGKIEVDPDSPAHLLTVRGIGYMFQHNSDTFIDGLTRDRFRSWPCCP
jgi:DNA-binding winged helix-turn-helix (wHTH) protein